MFTTNCRARVWASLQEPRVITILAVLFYATVFVMGVGILALTLARPISDTRDAVLVALGVIAIITGGSGAPLAWTGRHYLEAAVTLGLPAAGLLTVADTLLVLADGGDVTVPRVVWLSFFGGLYLANWGFARRSFLRSAGPYAVGRGPQLPEHRIRAAEEALDMQEVQTGSHAAVTPSKED